jgi:branched-subunit amino acid transport protein
MNIWLVMAACGGLTFLIRLSFIALEGRYRPPSWFVILLPFVPVAALSALTSPELILAAGEFRPANPRLWAGLVAIAVAAWRRNTLLTIGSGFAALLVLQRL